MLCVACDRRHSLQVLGSNSPDAPWLKAITERVLAVYCDRLSGYAWTSQVSSPRCSCLAIVHTPAKLQHTPEHIWADTGSAQLHLFTTLQWLQLHVLATISWI